MEIGRKLRKDTSSYCFSASFVPDHYIVGTMELLQAGQTCPLSLVVLSKTGGCPSHSAWHMDFLLCFSVDRNARAYSEYTGRPR